MKRVAGGLLGALAGLAFSTMGLTDMSDGYAFMEYGGNDATPTVIAVGVAIGAVLGAFVLWRWPLAIAGLIVGLAVGMWLRDNLGHGTVQPPWVFLLLFGLPLAGAAGGYALHLGRDAWARYPWLTGSAVGLVVGLTSLALISAAWTAMTHDPACDPQPLPGGGERVLLCPDDGSSYWINLVTIIIGATTGMVVRRKLEERSAP